MQILGMELAFLQTWHLPYVTHFIKNSTALPAISMCTSPTDKQFKVGFPDENNQSLPVGTIGIQGTDFSNYLRTNRIKYFDEMANIVLTKFIIALEEQFGPKPLASQI